MRVILFVFSLVSMNIQAMTLPFDGSMTICQGYNGEISHFGRLRLALDLSVAGDSAGQQGCTIHTASSSTGEMLYSPFNGIVAWRGATDPSIVCLNSSDDNISTKIGHIHSEVDAGDILIEGETELGTLRSEQDNLTGGYAHLHMQLFEGASCSGQQIDFGNMFGVDLYSDGTENQYSGTVLTRGNKTSWSTGNPYFNDKDITTELAIDGANALMVSISGVIEKDYDFLYVYDENGEQVNDFTGSINENFKVVGSSIKVRFVSDYSITDTGLTVRITEEDLTPELSDEDMADAVFDFFEHRFNSYFPENQTSLKQNNFYYRKYSNGNYLLSYNGFLYYSVSGKQFKKYDLIKKIYSSI